MRGSQATHSQFWSGSLLTWIYTFMYFNFNFRQYIYICKCLLFGWKYYMLTNYCWIVPKITHTSWRKQMFSEKQSAMRQSLAVFWICSSDVRLGRENGMETGSCSKASWMLLLCTGSSTVLTQEESDPRETTQQSCLMQCFTPLKLLVQMISQIPFKALLLQSLNSLAWNPASP